MTRISSFELFQCTSCGQIHMYPRYASYTPGSPPANLVLNLKDERTCQKCGVRTAIENYRYVGKTGSTAKAPIEWATPPEAKPENLLASLWSFFKRDESPKRDFKHFIL